MRTSEDLIELVEKNISDFYHEGSFLETHGAEEVDSEGGYEGVELDYAEVYEVEPREVVVTEYFKKDGK